MADLAPGTVLGARFEIAGVLGRGGMATVYLAQDRVRGDRIALKVLHPHLAQQPSSQARLRREVAAAGRIRHGSALVASELFELDGLLALSLPLHPGHTLAEEIDTHGPLPVEACWRLGADLAGALAEAHRNGVVHRDLSANNVMIDTQKRGMLTDFGLARLDDARSRTATTAVGTAGFTAPEVLSGDAATPGADLYGLGCVLYLAATGKRPFDGPSPLAIISRQSQGSFTPISALRPDAPPKLCAAIESMLARDAAQRPASAREVAEAFRRTEAPQRGGPNFSAPPPPDTPPPPPNLPAPRLPEGETAVWVIEHGEQHGRRETIRAKRRGGAAVPGLEGIITGIVEKVEERIRDAIGIPPGKDAELLLREAIAAEAGLPPDALVPVPALMARRFRLIDGVSTECAERLAEQARVLGFRAGISRQSVAISRRPLLVLLPLLFLALAGLPLISSLIPAPLVAAIIVALIVPTVIVALGTRPGGWRRRWTDQLPLAYSADLSRHLRPEIATRVYKMPTAARGAQRGAPAQTTVASPPGPEDPIATLTRRTGERLASLERAVAEASGRLPTPAVMDLQDTLASLRARALAVERALRAMGEPPDPGAEEEAAARVAARLDRQRARQRSGETIDDAELSDLERALAAHQARLAELDEDQQRAIRLQAALLEIGAVCERTRRVLSSEPDPARSVEDLLGQLRAEAEHAAAAATEAGAAPAKQPDHRKRAAAAARQGQG